MALESFDKQDLDTEVQDQLNDLSDPEAKKVDLTDTEVLLDHKTLMETFGINQENFKGQHMNAVKNVFQNMCGKTFDKIDMNDIYGLTHAQKSQLAREITALEKCSDTWILPFGKIKFNNLRKYLEDGNPMNIDSLNKGMNVNLSAKERDSIFKYIRDKVIEKSVDKYDLMRKKGDTVVTMQDIYSSAAGDLSTTMGIGGINNIGREFFAYNLENSDQITNSLEFGPYDSPAEIGISAYGFNGYGGSLTIYLGDEGGKIVWNYTKDGLNMDNNKPLPDGVSRENGVLFIPKEPPYNSNPIKIEIESYKKDEIMFNFQCKNASITPGGIAKNLRPPKVEEKFEPGVYKLAEGEKQDFLGGIRSIVNETKKTKKEDIPVVFEIGIDKKNFNNKNVLDGKVDDMWNNIKNKYGKNDKLIKKLNQEFDEFSSKIDLSHSFTPDQVDVQTKLAKLRFLEAIDIALTNYTFRQQLESGKININPKFSIGTRKLEAKIESEEDLWYKK